MLISNMTLERVLRKQYDETPATYMVYRFNPDGKQFGELREHNYELLFSGKDRSKAESAVLEHGNTENIYLFDITSERLKRWEEGDTSKAILTSLIENDYEILDSKLKTQFETRTVQNRLNFYMLAAAQKHNLLSELTNLNPNIFNRSTD